MSQVYASEPPTAGRVVFETTHGPIEIHLWSRECPATTRFFLQLCLDGFYDNCLWHRIVPKFLIQTGAIRSTELKDDASMKKRRSQHLVLYRKAIHAETALDRRQYELHSRLMFRRRGLIAMALGVTEDEDDLDAAGSTSEQGSMQPQFFITLEDAPHLNGKHVIFGSVNGPTIFNVVRIATKTHVNEETSQPVEIEFAPRIQSVKIIENPFQDLQMITSSKENIILPWTLNNEAVKDAKTKTRKRKGVKNINVLSFGSELEEDSGNSLGGMKSRIDVEVAPSKHGKVGEAKATDESRPSSGSHIQGNGKIQKDTLMESDAEWLSTSKGSSDGFKPEVDLQEEISQNSSIELQQSLTSEPSAQITARSPAKQLTVTDGNNEHIQISNQQLPDSTTPPSEASTKLSAVEAHRLKYESRAARKATKKEREEATMSKLFAFKSKVLKKVSQSEVVDSSRSGSHDVDNSLAARMARRAMVEENQQEVQNDDSVEPSYHGQVLYNSDDDGDGKSDWLKTKFKCRQHMDHAGRIGDGDVAGDGRNKDDYEVVDEKRQGNRRQARNRINDDKRGHERR